MSLTAHALLLHATAALAPSALTPSALATPRSRHSSALATPRSRHTRLQMKRQDGGGAFYDHLVGEGRDLLRLGHVEEARVDADRLEGVLDCDAGGMGAGRS